MVLTIDAYGFSIPFFDEWDAEGFATYVPLVKDQYDFASIFDSHNGHRITSTRLTFLTLFLLNGGWDPELQMIFSAFLHALTGALVVYVIVRNKVERVDLCSVCAIVLVFSIPFSWMSVLVAFQTQFYFMIFFATLSIFFLSESRHFLGYLFSVFSYLSMTPGAFILPAFIIGKVIAVTDFRALGRREVLHLMIASGIFLTMLLLRKEVTVDDAYSAQNIFDFSISTMAALWWPFRLSNVLGVFVYIPMLIYFSRSFFGNSMRIVLAILGVFVILQIIAMGYFRGADGVPPANRYLTILSLGICVNMLCLMDILKQRFSLKTLFFGSIWVIVVSYGVLMAARASLTAGLPERYEQNLVAQSIITEFLIDGNESVLVGYSDLEISYNDPERLVDLLSDPVMVSILPSTLNPANPDRLNSAKNFLFRYNPVLMSLGILALCIGCMSLARRKLGFAS